MKHNHPVLLGLDDPAGLAMAVQSQQPYALIFSKNDETSRYDMPDITEGSEYREKLREERMAAIKQALEDVKPLVEIPTPEPLVEFQLVPLVELVTPTTREARPLLAAVWQWVKRNVFRIR